MGEDDSAINAVNLPNGVTCNTTEDEQYILTVINCETPPPSDPPSDPPNNPPNNPPSIVIPEDPTPLAPMPEVTPEPTPELEEIPEEDVPLADVPKTGDASALWMVLSALSGTGLAGASLLGRKKREEI